MTPVDRGTVQSEVDNLVRTLLIAEPFYGHLLVGTVRVISDGEAAIRLMPSGHVVSVEVGARRWALLTPAARTAALTHELLHLTLKHPLRARSRLMLPLWGLACDLVVNQLFDASQLDEAFTIADFPEAGLSPDDSADAYYQRLTPLYEHCVYSPDSDDDDSDNRARDAMRRWLTASDDITHAHRHWQAFAAMPSPELSVLTANVDTLVDATIRRARTRGYGRLPANLVSLLDSITAKPQIPWRRVLRLFGATSERTLLRSTLSRPSKRYGTTPGIRVRRRTDLVVAVDTSGSVTIDDIGTFFAEIHDMWRRGATVTVLECDARVQREYSYRGTPPHGVKGRGGTSFTPAIQRANEINPDALIFLTDGYAPEPSTRARMPLLWVIARDGCSMSEVSHLPGRKVKLA